MDGVCHRLLIHFNLAATRQCVRVNRSARSDLIFGGRAGANQSPWYAHLLLGLRALGPSHAARTTRRRRGKKARRSPRGYAGWTRLGARA